MKTALSPRTALRFLQVEHQLQLLIDLQIAAALPVAPDRKGRDDDDPMRSASPRCSWLAAGVSLDADRVRLRSGKVVEGMFIGGDSKTVRVLLDNGSVSEVPLADAVAVEFSARKPPARRRRPRPPGARPPRRPRRSGRPAPRPR